MDEKVVFDKTTQQSEPGATPDTGPGTIPGTIQNPASQSPDPQDQSAAATQQSPEAPPSTDVPPTQPPPPPPPAGGIPKKFIIIGVVLLILFLLFIIFLFAPKKSEVKNVKLVWWGLWEDSRVMQPLIADYRKTHPHVQIEYIKKTPQDYRQQLLARVNKGSEDAPDIFRFHNTWVPMYKEVLLPLPEDVITKQEFKDNYYPVMQSDLIDSQGAILGVPMEADSLALFINTRLFKEAGLQPPKNWEHDFILTAQKLTQRDENGKIKIAGAALGEYTNVKHASDIMALLFAQQGVDTKKFDNREKEEGAFTYYLSFSGNEKSKGVWDRTLDQSQLAFAQGKLAMYFGYSWDVFDIKKLNPDLPFEVHPVPSIYKRNMTIASYWAEGVSAKSPNQKEALEFLHYLAQKETAQKFFSETSKVRAFGELYARKDLADTLKDNPLAYPFVSQLGNATSTIFSSDTWDGESGINTRANGYLGNAITALKDDPSTIETQLETFHSGLSQIYSDYGIQQE